MFLAIRGGVVVQRSSNELSLLKLDRTTHEVVEWNKPLPNIDRGVGEVHLDPRTSEQKTSDGSKRYRQRRLRAYPSLRKQLDMIYWDKVDGTTLWVDEIKRIKELFPKP